MYIFMDFVPKKKRIPWVLRLSSSGRRQCLKKDRMQALIECDTKISSLRSHLDEKTTELEALKSKLHRTEERI